MTALALLLVIAAALFHAIWNLLYKRAKDKPAFAWLFGLAAVVLYLPAFLFLVVQQPIPREGWYLIGASGVIHTLYFAFLGHGYSLGDLSLVYPLARGTGPLLVLVWATAFLSERVSPFGLAGILLVVGGVYLLHLRELSWRGLVAPLRSIAGRSTRVALLSGLLISLYTVIDKVGVSYVQPLVYMYLFTALYCLLYGPYVLRSRGVATIASEWRANALPIVMVGFLMVFTYTLVLFAMTLSNVSYVAAARELSVVFGAAMGTLLLKEPYGQAKVGGSILIALGVAMIGLARG